MGIQYMMRDVMMMVCGSLNGMMRAYLAQRTTNDMELGRFLGSANESMFRRYGRTI